MWKKPFGPQFFPWPAPWNPPLQVFPAAFRDTKEKEKENQNQKLQSESSVALNWATARQKRKITNQHVKEIYT